MQTSPSHRNNVCKMVLVALPSSFHHPCYCSHLTPPSPKCIQVCLHLGLYVCICNGVCCVSQGLSWLCHQRTAGLWDAPCVGTSVGKESCLSQCRETAAGRVFWLQSQELQLSLLLRTHSSADSGGPCLYSSRLSARPPRNHIWADCSFNIQVWYPRKLSASTGMVRVFLEDLLPSLLEASSVQGVIIQVLSCPFSTSFPWCLDKLFLAISVAHSPFNLITSVLMVDRW